jgi:chaperonin cofactor prefoldin
MTELEFRLLAIVQRLEKTHQERERQFGATLSDLTRRLNSGTERITTLTAQLSALNEKLERLQQTLNKRQGCANGG